MQIELISVLLAILATPWRRVRALGPVLFSRALRTLPVHAVAHAAGSHQALIDSVKGAMVLLPLGRAAGTVASKFVDTNAYAFVEFWILLGATDGVVDAKLQESVNADGSTPSDVTGGAITQIAANGDERMVVISAKAETLTKRYAGISITVGAGAVLDDYAVVAFRWGKDGLLPEELEAAGANSYLTAQVVRV